MALVCTKRSFEYKVEGTLVFAVQQKCENTIYEASVFVKDAEKPFVMKFSSKQFAKDYALERLASRVIALKGTDILQRSRQKIFKACVHVFFPRSTTMLLHAQELAATDWDCALTLIRQAAEEGNPDAQYWLAFELLNGKRIEKDFQKAVELLQQAADQGHVIAIYELGVSYESGRGVERNLAQAIALFRKAADQGLGRAYFDLAQRDPGIGNEGYLRAASLYQREADDGYVRSLCELAELYKAGLGVGRNETKAMELYELAAERGSLEAKYVVAERYMSRLGHEIGDDERRQMNEKIVRFMREAAEGGHIRAQEELGDFYAHAKFGVPRDLQTAIRWYQRAADQGRYVFVELGNLYYEQGAFEIAIPYYQRAADEDPEAAYQLGLCYRYGQGVPPDLQRAVSLFRQAHVLPEARVALEELNEP